MAIRIQVEWTGLGGAPYLSTFWGSGNGQVQADIAASVVADYLNEVDLYVSDQLTYRILPEAVDYSTPDTPVDVYGVASVSDTGTSSNPPLSRATQGLIRLRTGDYAGARRIQGRTFVPGPTTNWITPTTGSPTAAYVNGMTTAGNVLVNAAFMVPSRTQNDFFTITQASGWDQWAVLRSRRD